LREEERDVDYSVKRQRRWWCGTIEIAAAVDMGGWSSA